MAHKVMSEAFAEGDMTKAEAIVRKLFDLAMEGNVPAIKLLLDREWPAPTHHEISGDLQVSAMQQQIEAAALANKALQRTWQRWWGQGVGGEGVVNFRCTNRAKAA